MISHHPLTNPRLLLQLRDPGNHVAWSRFVQVYEPLVCGYCLRRGLQEADARDIWQEVLASVCHAIGRFDYEPMRGRFRGWLLTVTRRKITDFYRRSRRWPEPWNRIASGKDFESGDYEEQLAEWERAYHELAFRWAVSKLRPEVTERTWSAFVATAVDARDSGEVARE